jgi:phenylacetate-CoA ligase
MGTINRIIKRQPNFVKRLYYNLIPFSKRYGEIYSETLQFLDDVDKWDYHRTKEYQINELRDLLIYSKENVPYYGKLFADYEFNVNITSVEDLSVLPILTKDIINNNFNDLISKSFNGKKIKF